MNLPTEKTYKIGCGPMFAFFTILFVLKALDIGVVGTWSWWWITLPTWGPIALFIAVPLIVAGVGITGILYDEWRRNNSIYK